MKFVDSVKVHIQSGNGGAGCSSFRREKYIPRGGPNGGDGGHGGNLIFKGDPSKSTLLDLSFQQHQHAQNGSPGMGKDQHGKRGKDCIVLVPLGTVIKDSETLEPMMEILEPKEYLFFEGGRGGKGNARFKTSTNRAPEYCQPGEAGQEMWVRLELKLIADVGLVGFPNAGKSTFISAVSHARPKIADYPFTTLVPNLGVVQHRNFDNFVIADIPGIIENAHEGSGLGDRFLKHIERTSILAIILDVSGFAEHPSLEEYHILMRELKLFSEELIHKPRIVVFNKMDATPDMEEIETLEQQIKDQGEDVFRISAVTRKGIEPLIEHLAKVVATSKQEADNE